MKTTIKPFKHISFTALLLAILMNSCTVEKRVYSSGYHIDWHKNRHKASAPLTVDKNALTKNRSADSTTLPIISNSIHAADTIVADETITASTDEWAAIGPKKMSPRLSVPVETEKAVPHHRVIATKKAKTLNLKKRHIETEKSVQPEDTLKKQKSLLSTLWIFVTLNYLYCDLVGLMDATLLSQYLAGAVDGLVISQGFLLAASIFIEIPMIMILLSKVLKGKGNRNANIIAGLIMTVVQIATLFLGPVSIYYLFFSIIEIATTAFIVWYAWKKFPKKAK